MGADTADSSGRPLILVVDDDIQVAEYLRTLLSVQYRVVNRFDVDSALAWLDENTPPLFDYQRLSNAGQGRVRTL